MKSLIGVIALAILGAASCQTRPKDVTPDRPIIRVLAQKERAGMNCARIEIDNGKIVSVQLHGWQYLRALKQIDAAGCPEEFRLAWTEYLAAWERKLNQEQAAKDTLDLISRWKGALDDLPAIAHRLEAFDTEAAWQNCERAASEYGVQASAVGPD